MPCTASLHSGLGLMTQSRVTCKFYTISICQILFILRQPRCCNAELSMRKKRSFSIVGVEFFGVGISVHRHSLASSGSPRLTMAARKNVLALTLSHFGKIG